MRVPLHRVATRRLRAWVTCCLLLAIVGQGLGAWLRVQAHPVTAPVVAMHAAAADHAVHAADTHAAGHGVGCAGASCAGASCAALCAGLLLASQAPAGQVVAARPAAPVPLLRAGRAVAPDLRPPIG